MAGSSQGQQQPLGPQQDNPPAVTPVQAAEEEQANKQQPQRQQIQQQEQQGIDKAAAVQAAAGRSSSAGQPACPRATMESLNLSASLEVRAPGGSLLRRLCISHWVQQPCPCCSMLPALPWPTGTMY
jgi:hypothetical protein